MVTKVTKVVEVLKDGLTFNAKVWRKGDWLPVADIESETLRKIVKAGEHKHFELVDQPLTPVEAEDTPGAPEEA